MLERGVELLVADLRELGAGAKIGDLEVLQVAFEEVGDLVGALGLGERAGHGRGSTAAVPSINLLAHHCFRAFVA